MKYSATKISMRLTECIEALEDEQNSINTQHDYTHSDFRYDAEADRCLYRTGWSSGAFENDGGHFEKIIIVAFTGETLAKYAEQNGQTVEGDLTSFTAALDHWFPETE